MRGRSVVVVSDLHVPYHDKTAWAVCLAAIKALTPSDVVVIGDFVDSYPVSTFGKSPARRADLKFEIDAAHVELDRLQKVAGRAAIHYTAGNHEGRLETYIERQAPELYGLVTMPELLQIKQRGIHWVGYQKHFNIGKISYTHDVGYSGRNAVSQSLAAFGHSLVFGHTHRLGVVYGGTVRGRAARGLQRRLVGKLRRNRLPQSGHGQA